MITNLNYDVASLQSALLTILSIAETSKSIEDIGEVARRAVYSLAQHYEDNEIAAAVALQSK